MSLSVSFPLCEMGITRASTGCWQGGCFSQACFAPAKEVLLPPCPRPRALPVPSQETRWGCQRWSLQEP